MGTGGLLRRVEALERDADVDGALPCRGCGLGHLFDVLTLDRLAARYAGAVEPVPPICGCPCRAPIRDDLVGRLTWRERGAA